MSKILSFQTHFNEFLKQPDQFFLVFAAFIITKARSIVGLGLDSGFWLRLEIYRGETGFVMHSIKNTLKNCSVLILPLIFTTLF